MFYSNQAVRRPGKQQHCESSLSGLTFNLTAVLFPSPSAIQPPSHSPAISSSRSSSPSSSHILLPPLSRRLLPSLSTLSWLQQLCVVYFINTHFGEAATAHTHAQTDTHVMQLHSHEMPDNQWHWKMDIVQIKSINTGLLLQVYQ